jgi:uncharacterized protein (TIGR03000 family)
LDLHIVLHGPTGGGGRTFVEHEPPDQFEQKERTMLKKSFWCIVLTSIAGLALLLTPAISEAQRGGRGGRGGGGRTWSSGGGRTWSGGGRTWSNGNWNRGWDGRWEGNRGWGWGGFGAGLALGYGLGNWGGGGYPYYGGYYSDNGYSYPYYSDYSYEPYYTTDPSTIYYYQQTYPSTQDTYAGQAYYGTAQTSGAARQPANPNDIDVIVRVPDPNAQVWFDNYQTKQRGMVREFESGPLQPGKTYTYHLKAQWHENGQTKTQTKDVEVQPGQPVTVDFGNSANQTYGQFNQPPQGSAGAAAINQPSNGPGVTPPEGAVKPRPTRDASPSSGARPSGERH